jgi:hypothetical protein
MFYYEPKKELITLKCIYKNSDGKLHSLHEEHIINTINVASSPLKSKKDNQT